ncbi:MAG TPA: cyclic nucleotide-binding domain-containing protein [Kiritimatiellia bacterium]|nr:cyclic nucleotide-binding domain-containing protein [Kiritimatiellia bacterium]HPA78295.1 cyclic nucleotide-binding domain-containing protein [Kiritimatiellia bacterium]
MKVLGRDLNFSFGGGKKKNKRVSPIRRPAAVVAQLRASPFFINVDEGPLTKAVECMEQVRVSDGDVLIREGAEGDYYYLLEEGAAEVVRSSSSGDAQTVAELKPGAAFGEEALISFAPRNATVTMLSDGVVLRLHKQHFAEHIQNAVIRWLSPAEAKKEVEAGARWVDVRDIHEFDRSHLADALHIPMQDLRERMGGLDKERLYVCYCSNGRRSATATFILRQQGFNAAVLRGGLKSFS